MSFFSAVAYIASPMLITITMIKEEGRQYLQSSEKRCWNAMFGFSPLHIAKIVVFLEYVKQLTYLLWFCHYVKVYPTWDNFASWASKDKHTVRSGFEEILALLARKLPILQFRDRFVNWPFIAPSAILDGTDIPIIEPRNITWREKPTWCSHKIGSAALRYVLAVHCETGHFVWLSSAYPGATYEPTIIQRELLPLLDEGEKFLADRLYEHDNENFITALPYDCEQSRRVNSVRSLVERRIRAVKIFGILKYEYRSYNYKLHERVFEVVLRLLNLTKKATQFV